LPAGAGSAGGRTRQLMEQALKKLNVRQRVLYGMGNMGGNFLNLVFSMWVYKMYCDPEGGGVLVPVMWMTWAFIVGRVVDAVADPLIGYWSDNTSTRWGRRMPFLIFGGLPLCISFFLLWAPPLEIFPPNSVSLFVYLCVVMGAFWFLFTAVLCPYLALLPEVAVEPADRLNLATYQSVFLLASSGVVMVGSPFLKDSMGFMKMGLVFTILSLIGVYAPVAAVRERFVAKEEKSAEYGIFTALKWSFSNRPFVIYLASSVLSKIAFNALIMGMPFIVGKILGKSDAYVGIIMGGAGFFAVISFFGINAVAERIDKRLIYMAGMLIMALLIPCVWFFGRYNVMLDLSFIGIDAVLNEFVMAFIVFTLAGFPIAALMVLPPPILSDVIDLDEVNTGRRREAMYFGAQGLVEKAGMGLSGFMMGFLFDRFGYTVDNHMGVDLLGPVSAVLVFIGFLIFLWYPIDRKQSEEIRRKIAELHDE